MSEDNHLHEKSTREHVVTADDTAAAVGSGDVPVLGTPRLLAWLEGATVAACSHLLDEGYTSVGTKVELRHLKPSYPGSVVVASASLQSRDGRSLTFDVSARSKDGDLLAEGTVQRAIVRASRFIQDDQAE